MPIQNVRLDVAIEEYHQFRVAHSDKPNTISNHMQLLRKARLTWGNVTLREITPRHIAALFSANQWMPSTRNLYLSNLRTFFRWCRASNYMAADNDPTATWDNVTVPEVDRLRIPLHDFPRLLDAAPHPRDRAIVALGLFTFCRGSEIGTITIDDLDLSAGTVHIIRHKTGTQDNLPVSTELAREMTRWLNWYRADQGTLRGNWFLTPAKNPDLWEQDPATRRLVKSDRLAHVRPLKRETKPYRAVQRALRELGYPTRGNGEHTLRRSGARCLADRLRNDGYDLALMRVGSMLGHKDIKVTQHYIGWGLEREQRNAMLSGQDMFPELVEETGTLRVIGQEESHG